MKKILIFIAVAFLCQCTENRNVSLPHLEKRGEATQLIVDGKPFLALAGELHNSSSSSPAYMKNIWSRINNTNVNTLLAGVSWEQVEPQEGVFDFAALDDLISQARTHNIRLVLLWFGSWKNGISSYQPAWVKKDSVRFPLIHTKTGLSVNILSTFGTETLQADKKAYTAMLQRIRETDFDHRVIMVQVENEVGIHGDTRDYRPEAVAAFNSAVPEALINYLVAHKQNLLPELRETWEAKGGKTTGTWQEIFGTGDYTDELFMAWHYAGYMNDIAAAGKEQLALPVYVNAWLAINRPHNRPGDYPSGGPQAHLHDVWRAAAPAIDMLSPDIYGMHFPNVLKEYARGGNPVFVPESVGGLNGAANAVYAIGELNAIGYAPFGIEAGGYAVSNAAVINEQDVIKNTDPLTNVYRTLASMSDIVLEHQAKGTIRAVWLNSKIEPEPKTTIDMGDYRIFIELHSHDNSPIGYTMITMEAPDEFVLMGCNAKIRFERADGKGVAGLAKVQDGQWLNGKWVADRWLNGDEIQHRYDLKEAFGEKQSGQGLWLFGVDRLQKVWLY
jgi:beta-galactosidase GanA